MLLDKHAQLSKHDFKPFRNPGKPVVIPTNLLTPRSNYILDYTCSLDFTQRSPAHHHVLTLLKAVCGRGEAAEDLLASNKPFME